MNNSIQWNNQFLIGNDIIDDQHQTLFKIAQKSNYITDITNIDEQEELLKDILHELYEYVEYHFSQEEALMDDILYIDTDNHKQIHKHMLGELNTLTVEISYSKLSEITAKLNEFVQVVFVKHIKIEDQKISDFIVKN